jgi:hypothetical protein
LWCSPVVPEFIRPGFQLRKFDGQRSVDGVKKIFDDARRDNQQIWYFSAPASLPISVLEEMEINPENANTDLPVLTHEGASYGLTIGKQDALHRMKILIPSEDGAKYKLLDRPLNQTMHLKRITHMQLEQNKAAPMPKPPPRAQPNGLKTRWQPFGLPDASSGPMGRVESSEEEDVKPIPEKTFVIPRSNGVTPSPQRVQKTAVDEAPQASNEQKRKMKMKRKHAEDDEEEDANGSMSKKRSKKTSEKADAGKESEVDALEAKKKRKAEKKPKQAAELAEEEAATSVLKKEILVEKPNSVLSDDLGAAPPTAKKSKSAKKRKHASDNEQEKEDAVLEPSPAKRKKKTLEDNYASTTPKTTDISTKITKNTPILPPHMIGVSGRATPAVETPTSKLKKSAAGSLSVPPKSSKLLRLDTATPVSSSQPNGRRVSAVPLPVPASIPRQPSNLSIVSKQSASSKDNEMIKPSPNDTLAKPFKTPSRISPPLPAFSTKYPSVASPPLSDAVPASDVKSNKDGKPMKKRGRPPGSKSKKETSAEPNAESALTAEKPAVEEAVKVKAGKEQPVKEKSGPKAAAKATPILPPARAVPKVTPIAPPILPGMKQ